MNQSRVDWVTSLDKGPEAHSWTVRHTSPILCLAWGERREWPGYASAQYDEGGQSGSRGHVEICGIKRQTNKSK